MNKEQLSDKFWIYSVIEQKDFFFIKINWGINIAPENCFFDKRTNEVIFPENGIFINDIDFGADFWPHQIINDSLLIDFLDPLEILNDPEHIYLRESYFDKTILNRDFKSCYNDSTLLMSVSSS